jgi:hypothetical protein
LPIIPSGLAPFPFKKHMKFLTGKSGEEIAHVAPIQLPFDATAVPFVLYVAHKFKQPE